MLFEVWGHAPLLGQSRVSPGLFRQWVECLLPFNSPGGTHVNSPKSQWESVPWFEHSQHCSSITAVGSQEGWASHPEAIAFPPLRRRRWRVEECWILELLGTQRWVYRSYKLPVLWHLPPCFALVLLGGHWQHKRGKLSVPALIPTSAHRSPNIYLQRKSCSALDCSMPIAVVQSPGTLNTKL